MSVYEKVRQYHEAAGDDYGTEASRLKKYAAVVSLLPVQAGKTLLDVGCGTQRFRDSVPDVTYVGVDLVDGVNVLDLQGHWDLVVANGILYKLPDERTAKHLLYHCWQLADEAFVWTSLDQRGCYIEGELRLDPVEMLRWARKIAGTGMVKLDASYLPHDFAVAMYR